MAKDTVYAWDTTAANNTDIAGINIDEGCAPSGMNNAARSNMAQVADWRDQLTFRDAGGTANALTLTPAVTLAAYASRLVVTFRATETNSSTATLNVSGLGVRSIRKIVAGVDEPLVAGDIQDNGRYAAIYDATANSGNGAFILQTNVEPTEELSATLASGSATSLTTVTPKTVISVSLTAGVWDVVGMAYFIPAATTSVTILSASISLTNNTVNSTPGAFAQTTMAAQVPNGSSSLTAGPIRLTLAATTTVYLVANQEFSVSTMTAFGFISGRRVR